MAQSNAGPTEAAPTLSATGPAPAARAADDVGRLIQDMAQATPDGHLNVLYGTSETASLEPHWQRFFAQTLAAHRRPGNRQPPAQLLSDTFTRLQRNLRKRVEDNGVSYNLYADAVNKPRPWALDLFPMILPPAEWQGIAAGVRQRAELLDRMLADVYGEQSLVRDGLLPSALVHGHPGYLRPAHGIKPAGGRFLHVVAFDLARDAQGYWWIMSQRTQAPSGLGYALENRIIVAGLFPQAFASLQVQRLAASYRVLLANLAAHSPAGEDARIVLLTPGPYSETYFEHVYLARYLGITLVEGGDLVVRDQRLWLKTMEGLEPVDAVLRRLDDDFLDPLELRADSALGIPGLMQAWRAGNVVLANAPGTGFLESSATLGFLPAICERLLGEPLQLPSLASWWCGERAILPELFEHMPDYVIKPTFNDRARRFVPVLGRSLKPQEQAAWQARIAARPEDYSAQGYVPLAHMPTWRGLPELGEGNPAGAQGPGADAPMGSQAMVVRVFALADGQGSWHVMPGGLTRLAQPGRDVVSMYRGGSSADLWIMGEARNAPPSVTVVPVPAVAPAAASAIPATPAAANVPSVAGAPAAWPAHRHTRVISSRAAENLFWLGRYTERLENSVRHARIVLEALGDSEVPMTPACLQWLYVVAIQNGLVSEDTPSPLESEAEFSDTLLTALLDTSGENGIYSVASTLACLRQSAFSVRERLAQEQWHLINSAAAQFETAMRDFGHAPAAVPLPSTALQALDQLSTHVMAMTGAQLDRMTRDSGWNLLSMGRQIERMITLAQALRQAFVTEAVHDESGFSCVLRLFDSTITYRSRYQQQRSIQSLLELLVLDRQNPRSLSWVSDNLDTRMKKIDPSSQLAQQAGPESSPPHRWSESQLYAMTQQRDYDQIADSLARADEYTERLSELFSQQYFAHVDTENHALGSWAGAASR